MGAGRLPEGEPLCLVTASSLGATLPRQCHVGRFMKSLYLNMEILWQNLFELYPWVHVLKLQLTIQVHQMVLNEERQNGSETEQLNENYCWHSLWKSFQLWWRDGSVKTKAHDTLKKRHFDDGEAFANQILNAM